MNFYNPYLYTVPAATSTSFLSRLNLGSILNGTTRVLNFANQAIPMVKQISPMMKNMKTMFQIMNEFKKTDTPTDSISESIKEPTFSTTYHTNGPTFFI